MLLFVNVPAEVAQAPQSPLWSAQLPGAGIVLKELSVVLVTRFHGVNTATTPTKPGKLVLARLRSAKGLCLCCAPRCRK